MLPMRVVVVEDNRPFAEHLQRTLGALPGVTVVQLLGTQAEAEHWLARHPDAWDLAVIDIFLGPTGHGFGVLRYCARQQPPRPAVLLTSYTRDPVRECARECGAEAVFDKVREMDAFMAFVQQQAAAWQARPLAGVRVSAANDAQLAAAL